MISDRTTYKGQTYKAHPDSTNSPDRMSKYPVWSGYSINKYMDPTISGNIGNYGGNWNIIRYAEVLLSYLESKLESGAAIDQALLDQTINKVRGRQSVNMPPVTITDPTELRKIVRRERRVEFAFEGLRYYDILRWEIAVQELNRQFTGMKLTNDPANYTKYPVDNEGYFMIHKRSFKVGVNEFWPIPQSERNMKILIFRRIMVINKPRSFKKGNAEKNSFEQRHHKQAVSNRPFVSTKGFLKNTAV